MKVTVEDKEYNVKVAKSDEDKIRGLQGVKNLPEDEGMLFIYDEPQTVGFWMVDTDIPLDIIFINDDEEVISVYQGEPNDRTIAEEDNVKYVLEVNQGSGIQEGDDVDIEDDEESLGSSKMLVIGPDGNTQMTLEGGERIFRRSFTKQIVEWSKKAYSEKDEERRTKIYKRLGKKMFKELDAQDNRKPEYVKQ